MWIDVLYITFTALSPRNHASVVFHKNAFVLEPKLSNRDGGISGIFCSVQIAECKAMVGAMKCMYWLCKQEILCTTNFSSLLELA